MKLRTGASFLWLLAGILFLADSGPASAAPAVQAVTINGGAAQRSSFTSFALTFTEDVGASLQVGDLNITNVTTNTAVTGAVLTYNAATKTGTWTFPALVGKSLTDGNYNAFIRPADVTGAGNQQLTPNTGSTIWSTKFFRYFGDFDGDRDVDFLDTAKFKKANGQSSPAADYNAAADENGDGRVDATDLAEFQVNYLSILSGQTETPTITNAPVRTARRTITLSGTAAPDTRVVITNGFFTFEGRTDENGKFTITVGLLDNRINYLFVAADGFTATDTSTLLPVTITQDSTPPFLFVDSPSDASTVDTAAVTVTGRVADLLSGFDNLSVKVNNIAANVTAGIGPNGTFEAPNIALNMGENFITVTAADALGTAVTKSVMVTRIAQSQIEIVSGNDQTAVRNTELPAALVVRIKDTDGTLFANKIVNFQITRSDGHASPTQGQTTLIGPMLAQARTNALGIASIYWRVGSDAGKSNNLLVATSAGVPGEARFRASAQSNPPTQINVGMGNNQIGEAGGFAPLPLTAWVSDNLNGVGAIPVTFKVVAGDALVNLAASVTLPTDSTGHVDAYLSYGKSGGPVTVEATFPGQLSNPAIFLSRALVRKPGQPASFSAVVQDNTGLAIAGATCTLNVNGVKLPAALSDDTGAFSIPNVSPGAGFIQVDGRTATKLGGNAIPLGRFPSLVYRVSIVPNADNVLPTTVYLPTLNPANERNYDGTQDTELTIQGIAGLKMKIKAGSMTLADGTKPSAAKPITVSLNQVHTDNIPMPIQDGVAPLLTWTLQPPGAHFDPPVEIQYPNMTGLAPGSITNFLSYNHDIERFEIVASAAVSADGSVIKSDAGSGLQTSGWGCNCPPYAATGECEGPFKLKVVTSTASQTKTFDAVAEGGSGGYTYKWKLKESVLATTKQLSLPEAKEDDAKVPLSIVVEVTDTKEGQTKTQSVTANIPVSIKATSYGFQPVGTPAKYSNTPKKGSVDNLLSIWPTEELTLKVSIPEPIKSKKPKNFIHWTAPQHTIPDNQEEFRFAWAAVGVKQVSIKIDETSFYVYIDQPNVGNISERDAFLVVDISTQVSLAVYGQIAKTYTNSSFGVGPKRDAIRHSYWNALCASDGLTSAPNTLYVTTAHEYSNKWGLKTTLLLNEDFVAGQQAFNSTMDLRNNLIGIGTVSSLLGVPNFSGILTSLDQKYADGVMWKWDGAGSESASEGILEKSNSQKIYGK